MIEVMIDEEEQSMNRSLSLLGLWQHGPLVKRYTVLLVGSSSDYAHTLRSETDA